MDAAPGPVRICIGCRRRGPAADMARLTLVDGHVTVWHRKRPIGRGASLHAQEACVEQAIRTGAFARAFKRRVENVQPAELLRQIVADPLRASAVDRKRQRS